MTKFTKFIAPALIASLAIGAAPASAQAWRGGDNYREQIKQLDRQIDRAEDRRLITKREADKLERSVDQLQRQHENYARGGLSRDERRTLDLRISKLDREIKYEIAKGNKDRNDHRKHDDRRDHYRR